MDLLKGLAFLTRNLVQQATLFMHNKTGKAYILLSDDLIECTNGREELHYCLYANHEGKIFVRERTEFYDKFTKL